MRHEESINASSREEVFSLLRSKGIKAIKVVAADGSKANGEVRGVRRQTVVVSVIFAILITGFGAYILGPSNSTSAAIASVPSVAPEAILHVAKPLTRQMINGDRQRIEDAVNSLSNTVDRLLAAFAEPGRPIAEAPILRPSPADVEVCLATPLRYSDNEFTESVDLKRIVAKIKSELKNYIAEGGSVEEYINELVKRQKLELSYREKAERTLSRMLKSSPSMKSNTDKQLVYDFWLKANAQLQSMGIYPIPLPSQLRGYQATLDFDD